MTRLTRFDPLPTYEVRDPDGRPIGVVLAPRGEPKVGPGAETVLLVRPR